MFLPSHLHTGSGSDQKVPAPTGSATLLVTPNKNWGKLSLTGKAHLF